MTTRSPRVLIVGTCLAQPMGGVARHNRELLPRLADLLRAGGGDLAVTEGRPGISFDLPDGVACIPTDVPWLPTHRRALVESRAIRHVVESARPAFDVVHTAHLPAPRDLGLPMTLTIHDLRSLDLDRAPFVRRLVGGKVLARSIDAAARIGCVSRWMQGRIEAEFPRAAGKIDVIGNGADHLPLAPREPAEDPFLLHVGHIEPRKNLDLVVRALEAHPQLPRLVLAGAARGDSLDALRVLARELGVDDRVEHIDAPDDAQIAALYASASCAVFPSRLEGFGIGPAEAARAGCPVAVSNIPAHVEHLPDATLTFDVDDPDGCARALEETLREGAPLRSASGVRSWDDCALAWHEMLCRAQR